MIRRAAPAAALVLAAAVGLAACTPPAAEPTAWQQSVRSVAEQASAGDYASALASLDALEADVISRRDAGEITTAEADAILARIATVRADLTTPAPTPSASPTPEQTSEPEETVEPEETAEPTPSDTAEPTPSEPSEVEETTPANGNGNKGPGGGGPGGKDDKKPGDEGSSGPGKKDG